MRNNPAHTSDGLEERLRFESMLADRSSRFINLEPAALDAEIVNALRRVCEHLDIDIAALFQLSSEPRGQLTLTHLHRPPGGPPMPEDFDAREYHPWGLKEPLPLCT